MSPLEVVLLCAGVLLLVVALMSALVATVRLRGLAADVSRTEDSLRRLTERVEELVRREAAREAAEEADARETPATAEWVITYDGDDSAAGPGDRRTVATTQVVGTALGEPLIKVAALSHGVRRALSEEKRAHLAYQVRREYRRRRRETRARERTAQREAQRAAQRGAQRSARRRTAQ
jgi:Sec-independent protein translocase protein TatA